MAKNITLRFFSFYLIGLPLLFSLKSEAAPWLPMDDAYLKSDLQMLADAGLISVPINSYPIRWSRLDTDLQLMQMVQLPPSLEQAYQHLSYALNQDSIRNSRRKHVSLGYARAPRDDRSFAAPLTTHWQVQSSYEFVESAYAFRVAANYQRSPDKFGHEDTDYGLDDSYIAANWGSLNVTFGSLQHWWGPASIYNLAWGYTRSTVPGLNLAYDAYDWPILGSWHAETFLGFNETPNRNDKQWSNRFEFSPVNRLNIGLVYQKWFDKPDWDGYLTGAVQPQDGEQEQYSADIRLSLPVFNMGVPVTQSIYAQGASLVNDRSLGSLVIGWQSQFDIGGQSLRWVAEVKQLTGEAKQQWRNMLSDRATMVGQHNYQSISGMDGGEAKSLKLLWITPESWELTLQGQSYHQTDDDETLKKLTAYVRLPLANSRLTLGSDFMPDTKNNQTDKWNYWVNWDFRF
ncbi:capsule assembly Wzi family protein [Vibrio sp. MEBiC08052]|uniref:capsule assembly Wzi family protein n=1 Tax=Vibrio sp. MEBiC08052 TaxID=1761910 RepID=UPI0012FB039B|nr:capsule assembly Wzi family protein [Vibrio sp. MEBiC08052]